MHKLILIGLAGTVLLAGSCNNDQGKFDASGSFEAEETIISSEAMGTIELFDVDEGQSLKAGVLVGYIDSTQLYLKKKQLETQIDALLIRQPDIALQLASLQEQLAVAERERTRIGNLVKGDAATQKQLDDINANVSVLQKQIAAQRSSLYKSSEGIAKEVKPIRVQIEQLNDQLDKCRIVNPVSGTVLTKYAEAKEMANVGKALYKIADLSSITLRVYISGDQLPKIKLNEKVKVLTDDGDGAYKEDEGVVTWISDKAEFTPKTIQTKDERANMVYAVKVKVKNDGAYKIGMYGEIKFL